MLKKRRTEKTNDDKPLFHDVLLRMQHIHALALKFPESDSQKCIRRFIECWCRARIEILCQYARNWKLCGKTPDRTTARELRDQLTAQDPFGTQDKRVTKIFVDWFYAQLQSLPADMNYPGQGTEDLIVSRLYGDPILRTWMVNTPPKHSWDNNDGIQVIELQPPTLSSGTKIIPSQLFSSTVPQFLSLYDIMGRLCPLNRAWLQFVYKNAHRWVQSLRGARISDIHNGVTLEPCAWFEDSQRRDLVIPNLLNGRSSIRQLEVDAVVLPNPTSTTIRDGWSHHVLHANLPHLQQLEMTIWSSYAGQILHRFLISCPIRVVKLEIWFCDARDYMPTLAQSETLESLEISISAHAFKTFFSHCVKHKCKCAMRVKIHPSDAEGGNNYNVAKQLLEFDRDWSTNQFPANVDLLLALPKDPRLLADKGFRNTLGQLKNFRYVVHYTNIPHPKRDYCVADCWHA